VAVSETEAKSGTAVPGLPRPLLIDALELRARAQEASQATLVLVRNRDVEKLSQTVARLEPLWSDWKYSVWKIPPGKPEPVSEGK
jgi:hypothetical protein